MDCQLNTIRKRNRGFKTGLVKSIKMVLKKEKKNCIKVWEPSKNLPEGEKQRLVEYRKTKAG